MRRPDFDRAIALVLGWGAGAIVVLAARLDGVSLDWWVTAASTGTAFAVALGAIRWPPFEGWR